MAVKLYLTSGEERVVDADGARLKGAFFEVTRWLPHLHSNYTALTLRAQDVVRADIETDGVVTEHILGEGRVKQT